nr:immunoglobulin heavy chain junction region [Macaca mulatta]MOW97632.1 immunoglobulin heavy chain junction region [Macaca mulatta]
CTRAQGTWQRLAIFDYW